MHVVDRSTASPASHDGVPGAVLERQDPADWALQTRRVLTRDLLVRASHAQPGESRALWFRALHLNLPLVGEVADRLELTAEQLTDAEHAAIDGLLEAVRAYDPYGEQEFADVAATYLERCLRRHVGLPPVPPLSSRTARPSPR